MLSAKDYKPGDAIYTYVDPEGNNIHIDSEKLRQWCADNASSLEVVATPLNESIALSFLDNNVVDFHHLIEVRGMDKWDPIIYCADGTYSKVNGGPNVILADGHHRYFCAWTMGAEWVPAYVLEPAQWHPFQIDGLPQVTEEELRRAPTKAAYKRWKEGKP